MAQPKAYDIFITCRKTCVDFTKNCKCLQDPFRKGCTSNTGCTGGANGNES